MKIVVFINKIDFIVIPLCKMTGVRKIATFYMLSVLVVVAVFLFRLHRSSISHTSRFKSWEIHERNNSNHCALPPRFPASGYWKIMYSPYEIPSEKGVPHGTSLQIYCHPNYKQDSCDMSVCDNGRWIPRIARCLRTCPEVFSTEVVKVRCLYNNKVMRNCSGAVENTQIEFECEPYYENAICDGHFRTKGVCIRGQWSEGIPQCIPRCGYKSPMASPLIINGSDTVQAEFPWQVAIYNVRTKSNKFICCGGTLLNERIILTAAHCITVDGELQPKENYQVAVGKYYRKYDLREKYVQYSSVHDMFVPEGYRDSQHYFRADIAIIVANETFKLNRRVQPICMDWNKKYEAEIEASKRILGHVHGWGLKNETNALPETLQTLTVPLMNREKCKKLVSEEFGRFVTSDKICAGYVNKSKSVCKGDSGGGLTWAVHGRYFIIGVVSTTEGKNDLNAECNSQQVALYTLVYKYLYPFISKIFMRFKPHRNQLKDRNMSEAEATTVTPSPLPQLAKFSPKSIHCRKPITDSNFGNWSVMGKILMIHCSPGYKAEEGIMSAVCYNGKWLPWTPKCLKTCPSVMSTKIMNTSCVYKCKEKVSCVTPVRGTQIMYRCAPHYHYMMQMEELPYCDDGIWKPSVPKCVLDCRKFRKTPVGSGDPSEEVHPWSVAIYSNETLLCIGSLLNDRIVLTAPSCLAGSEGPNQNNVTVVVGNRNSNESQSKVNGYKNYFNSVMERRDVLTQVLKTETIGGLALIYLEPSVTFSERVHPVCIWKKALGTENTNGYIIGWKKSEPIFNPQVVRINIMPFSECVSNMVEDFRTNEGTKKICVRYGQNDIFEFEGGGLILEEDDRYFISGVLTEGRCKNQEYCLYTVIGDSLGNLIEQRIIEDNS